MSAAGHAALIAYPAQAAVDRPLPKNKIYAQGGVSTRVKDLFVQQVEQIVWQYKLAPETLNLPARPGVPEIQVLSLHLRTQKPHPDVLRAIDGAVQFPLVFELHCRSRVQVVACYRRPSDADSSRWVLSDYYASPWMPGDSPRAPLPVALDLGILYEQLLHRLMPLKARTGESLTDLAARITQAGAKRRELDKATARLEKEIQFNRKVEINSMLRQLQAELEQLSR